MKWLIGLLTAATGLLHIAVGFGWLGGGASTNWLLVLNGVGYLVLLLLFWTSSGSRSGTIKWILLAYTLITLIGYFVLNMGNNPFGQTIPLIIKAIELLLVILLLLYRSSEPVRTPAMTAAAPRMTAERTATTVTTTAANVAGGVGAAGAAAAMTAAAYEDRAGTTIDTTADRLAAETSAGYDTATGAVETAADKVGGAWDAATDEVSEAWDATTDRAGDAWDAVADTAEDAGDAVAETAEDAGDALGRAWDATTDTVGDAVDATGAALAGAGAAIYGAADNAVDETREFTGIGETTAAELDAAALAAEPSAAELRTELENYLRSFGPGSEFRKQIEYVEGIGPAFGAKLRGANVNTVLDLMVEGATRRGRKSLSERTGLAQSQILTWVNHIDLYRIKGVAEEYADLLEQSGVDTVVELAQRNPNNLFKRMNDINEQKALVRRLPHLSDVQSWVEQAKNLKRLIHY